MNIILALDETPGRAIQLLCDRLVEAQMTYLARVLCTALCLPQYAHLTSSIQGLYQPVNDPWVAWGKTPDGRNWLSEYFYSLAIEYETRTGRRWCSDSRRGWYQNSDRYVIISNVLESIIDEDYDLGIEARGERNFPNTAKHRLYGDFTDMEDTVGAYRALMINYWAVNEPTWSGWNRRRPSWAGGPVSSLDSLRSRLIINEFTIAT